MGVCQEICDGNFGSRKRNIYFIKIENGKEIRQTDTLHELIASDEDLPQLEGSQKQIDWAESIRSKFVSNCKLSNKKVPTWVANTNAKFWIDNRTKLG